MVGGVGKDRRREVAGMQPVFSMVGNLRAVGERVRVAAKPEKLLAVVSDKFERLCRMHIREDPCQSALRAEDSA